MAQTASGQPAGRPLPPGLDLLWGRRERGRRGPRPGLSAKAIAAAAIRELVDEPTYPHLYRLAWAPEPDEPRSEREEFLSGVDTILDGVQARINRASREY